MKGFFIEISNGLLDPKHFHAMGGDRNIGAVWLFMWFLDKITSVSEEGVGKVLGGKPIKYEDFKKDLNVSRATYKRWIVLLKNGGYINTVRTPQGLIFSINKAKKRFNQKTSDGSPMDSDGSPTDHLMAHKSTIYNKTIQLDKTKDILRTDSSQISSEQQRELVDYLVVKKKMPHNPDKPPSSALTPVYAKQAHAIKLILKAGYTTEDIKWGVDQLAKDDFYFSKFDLMTVYKRLPFLKAEEAEYKQKHAWEH